MDIKEIAKKYTREEFINTFVGMCPSRFNMDCPKTSSECTEKYNYDCRKCLRQAVKDIKFKDNLEENNKLVVRCIAVGNGNYLNMGEDYVVEKEEDLHYLIKIRGIDRKFKKSRFEIVEGDKMEDKTIKVRCKWSDGTLELEKIYPVIEDAINGYVIKGDDNKVHIYAKDMFEKVEDVLIVECINDLGMSSELISGEKYKVTKEDKEYYWIIDNNDEERYYLKTRFKRVEPQKEVKEYTLMELLDFPVGTKFKDKDGYCVKIVNTAEGDEEKAIECTWNNEEMRISTAWARMKFTKVEEPKPVSTAEAFKALDEGRIIESEATGNKYRRHLIDWDIYIKTPNDKEFKQAMCVECEELENTWIVKED